MNTSLKFCLPVLTCLNIFLLATEAMFITVLFEDYEGIERIFGPVKVKYDLGNKIGRGASGIVYKASFKKTINGTERLVWVAIKVGFPKIGLGDNVTDLVAQARNALWTEFRLGKANGATEKKDYPGVPFIHGIGEAEIPGLKEKGINETVAVLVMELYDTDFHEYISQEKSFPRGDTDVDKHKRMDIGLEFLHEALAALQHNAKKNIIHRDVKPYNFLGRIRDGRFTHTALGDYGLGRLQNDTPENISGTDWYYSLSIVEALLKVCSQSTPALKKKANIYAYNLRDDIEAILISLYEVFSKGSELCSQLMPDGWTDQVDKIEAVITFMKGFTFISRFKDMYPNDTDVLEALDLLLLDARNRTFWDFNFKVHFTVLSQTQRGKVAQDKLTALKLAHSQEDLRGFGRFVCADTD